MENNIEINILTKDLLQCLNFASGFVDKKTVKSILSNIKLETIGSELLITGTSSDISIKMSLSGEVINQGSTTVNAATMSELIKKITDKTIKLKQDENNDQLIIEGKNFVSHLTTLPSKDFPSLDNKIETEFNIKIPSKKLLRLLSSSEFAISSDDTRYNLNGIFLNSEQLGLINATAIDGHRIASVTEDTETNKQFGIIIPKRSIYELLKILKDPDYLEIDTEISFDSRRASFSIGNIEITSKLTDATFPEYSSLFPKSYTKKLTLHSKYLASVVDRVSSITNDKFRAIKFVISNDFLEISAFGETKGNAKELIVNNSEKQNYHYEGERISIGFNPLYLLDILKNFEDNEIDILLNTENDPLIVKPALYQKDSYLIMPMQV